MFGTFATVPTQWIDSTQLRLTTPPSANSEMTTSLTLTNPDSQTATAFNAYTYLRAMYTLDGYGGLHPDGGTAPAGGGPYWPGWKIARAAVLTSDGGGGLELDGYGGLHPFGSVTFQPVAAYFGWDIARDVALMPGSSIFNAQGYTLDGYGGVHAFGGAPMPSGFAYWGGWDIARKIKLLPDGSGGYVMDGYGGLHGFATGSNPMPPVITSYAYWHGWAIARDFALTSSSSAGAGVAGVSLDGLGGVHPFGNVSTTLYAPYAPSASRDIFRAVSLGPGAQANDLFGWAMDGYGRIIPFGTVAGQPLPQILPSGGYWPNWDIAVALIVN